MSYGPTPIIENLLYSGSKDMDVNGASVNKTFTYSPGGTNAVKITELTCVLHDEGTTSLNKFGNLSALTQGCVIQATVNGVTTTLATLKDGGDLSATFFNNQFGNSAVLSLLGIVTAQGFGASNNIFVGSWKFSEPLELQGSDSLSLIVKDDLTGLDLFYMRFNGMKIA